ncbi:MAG: OmpH family outer membrane protein, partial [Candidatus Eremiobacteraeota bacterium]|nr:OmpH family outer membrane protein [Candidatus Eremiobacteraeota bacterium]
ELATKDAAQRLQLRTQLANLALDDAAREDVRKKIAALDRAEADQVAAMRNRDQATLASLRAQLQEQAKTEIASGVAKIHAENQAKMLARAGGAAGTTAVAVPGTVVAGRSVPPDIKAKIDALHKEYQDRFNRDAKTTIEQFNKTRDELKKRYDELHGIDTASQASARKELAMLQAQHDKLYAQIVEQINREVRVVAQTKGVTTVLSEVAGPGEGIDLTGPAKKEIESLHE